MRLGSKMKKTGSFLLIIVGFLSYVMTWQVNLLSPLGGVFIMGGSIAMAILIWLDAEESQLLSGKKDVGRSKTGS
ncbi:hypothetical protein [Paenibacillus sp. SI8]|uniref:hypothetical protein n=1 Tax=unclassified Paenibacillus TaxID=185978 RepID=UPI00346710AD